MPLIVAKLYQRWKKRIFANDDIACQPSEEGEGYWDIVITRGDREARLIVSPTAYQNPRFMLEADDTMRFALRQMKTAQ